MNIYLGNINIDEFERRTGWSLTTTDKNWLISHRIDLANVKHNEDSLHIFDIPFSIHVSESIKDRTIKLLNKYNKRNTSKEPLTIVIITETEEEKIKREKQEFEKKQYEDRINNPNSIWNIKWHMLIPVPNNYSDELYFNCFINTYTTGRNNIPDIINGTIKISKDSRGFHGTFILDNPEKYNDANEHDNWNWVIGSGYITRNGRYLPQHNNEFEEVTYSIKDAIELYNSIYKYGNSKEIHFYK